MSTSRDHLLFRRLVCAVLSLTYVISYHLHTPGMANASSDIPGPSVYKEVPPDLTSIAIPESLGRVQELFQGEGKKIVVIVQDAHAIPDAQRSIQKLIEFFQVEYGFRLIAVEGASSTLDPSIFKSFPDKELLQKIFEDYFNRGELTGSVAAAIFNRNESVYHGIEEWNLFEEGVIHFLDSMKQEKAVLETVSRQLDTLSSEKKRVYSPDLLEVDQALENFRHDYMDLIPVLQKLAEYKVPEGNTEVAVMLEESRRNNIQDTSLELEVKKIALQIKAFFESRPPAESMREDIKSFHEQYQAFLTSRLAPDEFALHLKELAIKHRIRVRVSKKLDYLVRNQKRVRDIKGTRLFREFEDYARSVKESLFRNQDERRLDQRSEELYLFEKLAKLELSQEDWKAVKSMIQAPDEIVSGEVTLPGGVDPILESLRPNIAFYFSAVARDHVFIREIRKLMQEYNTRQALMVAGGFHAEGLTYRLRQEDTSYLLLMPAIGSIPEVIHYKDHMQGEVTWGEYYELEPDGRVNVYKAFVRATRDLLLKHGNQDAGRMLKGWRDQIIRDLADAGRIEEASGYTRFIDELTEDRRPDTGSLWAQRIDQFVAGLKNLEASNQLNEQNIVRLLQPIAGSQTVHQGINLASRETASVAALGSRVSNLKEAVLTVSREIELTAQQQEESDQAGRDFEARMAELQADRPESREDSASVDDADNTVVTQAMNILRGKVTEHGFRNVLSGLEFMEENPGIVQGPAVYVSDLIRAGIDTASFPAIKFQLVKEHLDKSEKADTRLEGEGTQLVAGDSFKLSNQVEVYVSRIGSDGVDIVIMEGQQAVSQTLSYAQLNSEKGFIFGRAANSSYVLESEQVSRSHAQLSLSDGRLILRDLESRNGTLVPLRHAVFRMAQVTDRTALVKAAESFLRLNSQHTLQSVVQGMTELEDRFRRGDERSPVSDEERAVVALFQGASGRAAAGDLDMISARLQARANLISSFLAISSDERSFLLRGIDELRRDVNRPENFERQRAEAFIRTHYEDHTFELASSRELIADAEFLFDQVFIVQARSLLIELASTVPAFSDLYDQAQSAITPERIVALGTEMERITFENGIALSPERMQTRNALKELTDMLPQEIPSREQETAETEFSAAEAAVALRNYANRRGLDYYSLVQVITALAVNRQGLNEEINAAGNRFLMALRDLDLEFTDLEKFNAILGELANYAVSEAKRAGVFVVENDQQVSADQGTVLQEGSNFRLGERTITFMGNIGNYTYGHVISVTEEGAVLIFRDGLETVVPVFIPRASLERGYPMGRQAGTERSITGEQARLQQADIQEGVHAVLTLENGQLVLKDANSRSGTYVERSEARQDDADAAEQIPDVETATESEATQDQTAFLRQVELNTEALSYFLNTQTRGRFSRALGIGTIAMAFASVFAGGIFIAAGAVSGYLILPVALSLLVWTVGSVFLGWGRFNLKAQVASMAFRFTGDGTYDQKLKQAQQRARIMGYTAGITTAISATGLLAFMFFGAPVLVNAFLFASATVMIVAGVRAVLAFMNFATETRAFPSEDGLKEKIEEIQRTRDQVAQERDQAVAEYKEAAIASGLLGENVESFDAALEAMSPQERSEYFNAARNHEAVGPKMQRVRLLGDRLTAAEEEIKRLQFQLKSFYDEEAAETAKAETEKKSDGEAPAEEAGNLDEAVERVLESWLGVDGGPRLLLLELSGSLDILRTPAADANAVASDLIDRYGLQPAQSAEDQSLVQAIFALAQQIAQQAGRDEAKRTELVDQAQEIIASQYREILSRNEDLAEAVRNRLLERLDALEQEMEALVEQIAELQEQGEDVSALQQEFANMMTEQGYIETQLELTPVKAAEEAQDKVEEADQEQDVPEEEQPLDEATQTPQESVSTDADTTSSEMLQDESAQEVDEGIQLNTADQAQVETDATETETGPTETTTSTQAPQQDLVAETPDEEEKTTDVDAVQQQVQKAVEQISLLNEQAVQDAIRLVIAMMEENTSVSRNALFDAIEEGLFQLYKSVPFRVGRFVQDATGDENLAAAMEFLAEEISDRMDPRADQTAVLEAVRAELERQFRGEERAETQPAVEQSAVEQTAGDVLDLFLITGLSEDALLNVVEEGFRSDRVSDLKERIDDRSFNEALDALVAAFNEEAGYERQTRREAIDRLLAFLQREYRQRKFGETAAETSQAVQSSTTETGTETDMAAQLEADQQLQKETQDQVTGQETGQRAEQVTPSEDVVAEQPDATPQVAPEVKDKDVTPDEQKVEDVSDDVQQAEEDSRKAIDQGAQVVQADPLDGLNLRGLSERDQRILRGSLATNSDLQTFIEEMKAAGYSIMVQATGQAQNRILLFTATKENAPNRRFSIRTQTQEKKIRIQKAKRYSEAEDRLMDAMQEFGIMDGIFAGEDIGTDRLLKYKRGQSDGQGNLVFQSRTGPVTVPEQAGFEIFLVSLNGKERFVAVYPVSGRVTALNDAMKDAQFERARGKDGKVAKTFTQREQQEDGSVREVKRNVRAYKPSAVTAAVKRDATQPADNQLAVENANVPDTTPPVQQAVAEVTTEEASVDSGTVQENPADKLERTQGSFQNALESATRSSVLDDAFTDYEAAAQEQARVLKQEAHVLGNEQFRFEEAIVKDQEAKAVLEQLEQDRESYSNRRSELVRNEQIASQYGEPYARASEALETVLAAAEAEVETTGTISQAMMDQVNQAYGAFESTYAAYQGQLEPARDFELGLQLRGEYETVTGRVQVLEGVLAEEARTAAGQARTEAATQYGSALGALNEFIEKVPASTVLLDEAFAAYEQSATAFSDLLTAQGDFAASARVRDELQERTTAKNNARDQVLRNQEIARRAVNFGNAAGTLSVLLRNAEKEEVVSPESLEAVTDAYGILASAHQQYQEALQQEGSRTFEEGLNAGNEFQGLQSRVQALEAARQTQDQTEARAVRDQAEAVYSDAESVLDEFLQKVPTSTVFLDEAFEAYRQAAESYADLLTRQGDFAESNRVRTALQDKTEATNEVRSQIVRDQNIALGFGVPFDRAADQLRGALRRAEAESVASDASMEAVNEALGTAIALHQAFQNEMEKEGSRLFEKGLAIGNEFQALQARVEALEAARQQQAQTAAQTALAAAEQAYDQARGAFDYFLESANLTNALDDAFSNYEAKTQSYIGVLQAQGDFRTASNVAQLLQQNTEAYNAKRAILARDQEIAAIAGVPYNRASEALDTALAVARQTEIATDAAMERVEQTFAAYEAAYQVYQGELAAVGARLQGEAIELRAEFESYQNAVSQLQQTREEAALNAERTALATVYDSSRAAFDAAFENEDSLTGQVRSAYGAYQSAAEAYYEFLAGQDGFGAESTQTVVREMNQRAGEFEIAQQRRNFVTIRNQVQASLDRNEVPDETVRENFDAAFSALNTTIEARGRGEDLGALYQGQYRDLSGRIFNLERQQVLDAEMARLEQERQERIARQEALDAQRAYFEGRFERAVAAVETALDQDAATAEIESAFNFLELTIAPSYQEFLDGILDVTVNVRGPVAALRARVQETLQARREMLENARTGLQKMQELRLRAQLEYQQAADRAVLGQKPADIEAGVSASQAAFSQNSVLDQAANAVLQAPAGYFTEEQIAEVTSARDEGVTILTRVRELDALTTRASNQAEVRANSFPQMETVAVRITEAKAQRDLALSQAQGLLDLGARTGVPANQAQVLEFVQAARVAAQNEVAAVTQLVQLNEALTRARVLQANRDWARGETDVDRRILDFDASRGPVRAATLAGQRAQQPDFAVSAIDRFEENARQTIVRQQGEAAIQAAREKMQILRNRLEAAQTAVGTVNALAEDADLDNLGEAIANVEIQGISAINQAQADFLAEVDKAVQTVTRLGLDAAAAREALNPLAEESRSIRGTQVNALTTATRTARQNAERARDFEQQTIAEESVRMATRFFQNLTEEQRQQLEEGSVEVNIVVRQDRVYLEIQARAALIGGPAVQDSYVELGTVEVGAPLSNRILDKFRTAIQNEIEGMRAITGEVDQALQEEAVVRSEARNAQEALAQALASLPVATSDQARAANQIIRETITAAQRALETQDETVIEDALNESKLSVIETQIRRSGAFVYDNIASVPVYANFRSAVDLSRRAGRSEARSVLDQAAQQLAWHYQDTIPANEIELFQRNLGLQSPSYLVRVAADSVQRSGLAEAQQADLENLLADEQILADFVERIVTSIQQDQALTGAAENLAEAFYAARPSSFDIRSFTAALRSRGEGATMPQIQILTSVMSSNDEELMTRLGERLTALRFFDKVAAALERTAIRTEAQRIAASLRGWRGNEGLISRLKTDPILQGQALMNIGDASLRELVAGDRRIQESFYAALAEALQDAEMQEPEGTRSEARDIFSYAQETVSFIDEETGETVSFEATKPIVNSAALAAKVEQTSQLRRVSGEQGVLQRGQVDLRLTVGTTELTIRTSNGPRIGVADNTTLGIVETNADLIPVLESLLGRSDIIAELSTDESRYLKGMLEKARRGLIREQVEVEAAKLDDAGLANAIAEATKNHKDLSQAVQRESNPEQKGRLVRQLTAASARIDALQAIQGRRKGTLALPPVTVPKPAAGPIFSQSLETDSFVDEETGETVSFEATKAIVNSAALASTVQQTPQVKRVSGNRGVLQPGQVDLRLAVGTAELTIRSTNGIRIGVAENTTLGIVEANADLVPVLEALLGRSDITAELSTDEARYVKGMLEKARRGLIREQVEVEAAKLDDAGLVQAIRAAMKNLQDLIQMIQREADAALKGQLVRRLVAANARLDALQAIQGQRRARLAPPAERPEARNIVTQEEFDAALQPAAELVGQNSLGANNLLLGIRHIRDEGLLQTARQPQRDAARALMALARIAVDEQSPVQTAAQKLFQQLNTASWNGNLATDDVRVTDSYLYRVLNDPERNAADDGMFNAKATVQAARAIAAVDESLSERRPANAREAQGLANIAEYTASSLLDILDQLELGRFQYRLSYVNTVLAVAPGIIDQLRSISINADNDTLADQANEQIDNVLRVLRDSIYYPDTVTRAVQAADTFLTTTPEIGVDDVQTERPETRLDDAIRKLRNAIGNIESGLSGAGIADNTLSTAFRAQQGQFDEQGISAFIGRVERELSDLEREGRVNAGIISRGRVALAEIRRDLAERPEARDQLLALSKDIAELERDSQQRGRKYGTTNINAFRRDWELQRPYQVLPVDAIEAEKHLPYAPGLKNVRYEELQATFSEQPSTVGLSWPEDASGQRYDVFLAGKDSGSSAGIRIAFLEDRPVAVKTYMKNVNAEEVLPREFLRARLAEVLGIGPAVHGIYEENGQVSFVTDIVPGDGLRTNDQNIRLETIRDLIEIKKRLDRANEILAESGSTQKFSMRNDFQYLITAAGKVEVIDATGLLIETASDRISAIFEMPDSEAAFAETLLTLIVVAAETKGGQFINESIGDIVRQEAEIAGILEQYLKKRKAQLESQPGRRRGVVDGQIDNLLRLIETERPEARIDGEALQAIAGFTRDVLTDAVSQYGQTITLGELKSRIRARVERDRQVGRSDLTAEWQAFESAFSDWLFGESIDESLDLTDPQILSISTNLVALRSILAGDTTSPQLSLADPGFVDRTQQITAPAAVVAVDSNSLQAIAGFVRDVLNDVTVPYGQPITLNQLKRRISARVELERQSGRSDLTAEWQTFESGLSDWLFGKAVDGNINLTDAEILSVSNNLVALRSIISGDEASPQLSLADPAFVARTQTLLDRSEAREEAVTVVEEMETPATEGLSAADTTDYNEVAEKVVEVIVNEVDDTQMLRVNVGEAIMRLPGLQSPDADIRQQTLTRLTEAIEARKNDLLRRFTLDSQQTSALINTGLRYVENLVANISGRIRDSGDALAKADVALSVAEDGSILGIPAERVAEMVDRNPLIGRLLVVGRMPDPLSSRNLQNAGSTLLKDANAINSLLQAVTGLLGQDTNNKDAVPITLDQESLARLQEIDPQVSDALMEVLLLTAAMIGIYGVDIMQSETLKKQYSDLADLVQGSFSLEQRFDKDGNAIGAPAIRISLRIFEEKLKQKAIEISA